VATIEGRRGVVRPHERGVDSERVEGEGVELDNNMGCLQNER